jgi:predicted ATPase
MRLKSVSVSNYKSLRQISWEPGPYTVIIGANASGKSNLADFYDFLSDLYRHGLAIAVARKGGYENIAHRKMRRSRGAIKVDILGELTRDDMRGWPFSHRPTPPLRFHHSFSFQAENRAIRSDFRIQHETLELQRKDAGSWQIFAEIGRENDKLVHTIHRHQSANSEWDQTVKRMFRFF